MKRRPELGYLVVADLPVWLTRNTPDQLANAITPIAG